MNTIEMDVPDMSCGHCVHAIESALSSIEDVTAVEVSLEGHRATVTTAAPVDTEILLAAVRDAGYTPTLTQSRKPGS